jgi:hypothetical protein
MAKKNWFFIVTEVDYEDHPFKEIFFGTEEELLVKHNFNNDEWTLSKKIYLLSRNGEEIRRDDLEKRLKEPYPAAKSYRRYYQKRRRN